MAANSVVSIGIGRKLKLIHVCMYFLVIYKNEEDQMKIKGASVATTCYIYVLDAQRQLIL